MIGGGSLQTKTATDYQKEYVDKTSKLEGLEARIKARALELCKQHPTAPIGMGAVGREIEKFPNMDTVSYIYVIKNIEDHNAREDKHVQTTIFPKS